jgi:hypothetical protein
VQELRAFSQWMQFALSVDGCSLLSRTSDDVLKIMRQQLEWFKSVQGLKDQTTQLQQAVADQTRLLQDDYNAKTRNDILSWISKLDYDRKHQTIRSPRVQDTGSWLLERVEYVRWRDGDCSSNILWCHGIQGSGNRGFPWYVITCLSSATENRGDNRRLISRTVQWPSTSSWKRSPLLVRIQTTRPPLDTSIIINVDS